VNAERPSFSCLALSGGDLSCLDVFRMRIPADLIVLSACDTGLGRYYEAEGLLGWTRAFLFAGTPRVIVSLWKVDDAATAALMKRFYESWNPKDPAKRKRPSQALLEAQRFVASQPAWSDPFFWAAWQLWGLPD
jgi:CHAT domain-containing protein